MKPTQYSKELADELLDRIRGGETLKSVCLDPAMPTTNTVWLWQKGKNGATASFTDDYARARLDQADSFAADIIEIADNSDETALDSAMNAVKQLPPDATETERRRAFFFAKKRSMEAAKLQIDARKWTAARINPNRWGERVTHELTSNPDRPLQIDFNSVGTEQLERLAELERELRGEKVIKTEMKRIPNDTTDAEYSELINASKVS